MTLIEVLAALAILSTLLTTVLLAHSRAQRQFANARLRLQAVAAADTLIAGWWLGDGVPTAASGEFDDGPVPIRWRTVVSPSAQAAQLDARIVQLHVLQSDTLGGEQLLLTVELLESTLPAARERGLTAR